MKGTNGIIIFFLLLYLLLPTQNSTLDAYYYAACVRYGENLFSAHHLLYNGIGFLLKKLLNSLHLHPDELALLKAMNAVAAAGCLSVFGTILQKLDQKQQKIQAMLLVAGSSFGVWRFATENETYILPLLFSLLGSWCFVNFVRQGRRRQAAAAGFFAAFACLIHQVHVFWWLGLLAGTWFCSRNFKTTACYLLPALLVPLAYALALLATHAPVSPEALFRFALHDYFSGSASAGPHLKQSLLLTPINLFRTFLQVHGLQLVLLRKSLLWLLPAFISLVLLFYAFFRKTVEKRFAAPWQGQASRPFLLTHGLIALLHTFFAAYTAGNAEFMVMLPFLLVLLSIMIEVPVQTYLYTGLAFLVWNFSYGIFPNYFFRYSNNEALLQQIRRQPEQLFILAEDAQVRNEYYYQFGEDNAAAILRPPAAFIARGQQTDSLQLQLKQALQNGRRVYTDCLHRPQVLNRAAMVMPAADAAFFQHFRQVPADTFPTFFGNRILTEIRLPAR